MFCNLFKCKTGVYSNLQRCRFAIYVSQGGGVFRDKIFSRLAFCFAWPLLLRRGEKFLKTVRTEKDKRFSLLFIFP